MVAKVGSNHNSRKPRTQQAGLTGSLLGVLGLGTVHEQGEDLGGWVHLAQQGEDGAHVFADPVLGLPHLRQRAVRRSEKEGEREREREKKE